MGVLCLGAWLRPDVRAGSAMAPALIAAIARAMSRDRAARLTEIEAMRSAE